MVVRKAPSERRTNLIVMTDRDISGWDMAGFRYLSPAHLQGFSQYKYSSIDTSPLSNYVMHPFWNNVVKLVPMWVAPNLLTFTGWCLLVVNFFILAFYDWDYYTTTNDLGIVRPPIPEWVWLFCAISHFLAHTLDGIDGKQARRTGMSTPLGELFDHGLDSWATILLPLTLFSALGRGGQWGANTYETFFPCVAVLAGFYISHWEKYITGVLYLPWVYDITQLACALGYLVTYVYGTDVWQFNTLPGLNCARTFKWLLIIGFVGAIPMTLWNIYNHYKIMSREKPSSQSSQPNGTPSASSIPPPHCLSFLEAIAPGLPFCLMTVLYTFWIYCSPSDIIERHPRVFYFTLGIVFSNIACRLIISQMSGHPCDLFNRLLVPLALAIAASILLPRCECCILYFYAVIVLLAHIHYGVSVVQELCEHFKIYCFSVAKREPIP